MAGLDLHTVCINHFCHVNRSCFLLAEDRAFSSWLKDCCDNLFNLFPSLGFEHNLPPQLNFYRLNRYRKRFFSSGASFTDWISHLTSVFELWLLENAIATPLVGPPGFDLIVRFYFGQTFLLSYTFFADVTSNFRHKLLLESLCTTDFYPDSVSKHK